MQIVIPMSGFGERFRRAGFDVPKPLIEVDGKPIIAHVVDLFPGFERLVFICNAEHLEDRNYDMAGILRSIAPGAEIVAIEPHRLGPVHAVLQAAEAIDRELPTIVNYCDFTCFWDFAHFGHFVREAKADGAIVCYRGFHPHMLGSTNYAYVREQNGWVLDIQEKQPYTETPMQEFASSGTYYYASGDKALSYFERAVAEGHDLNGEYYVSLAYKPMLADRQAIAVYEIQHFMQWGTPEDLADYCRWSALFRDIAAAGAARQSHHPGRTLVPMAGLGSRFSAQGYDLPKPLIPVSGRPMAVQAVADLPRSDGQTFVLRQDLPRREEIEAALRDAFADGNIVSLEGPTDGQARTCLLAMDAIDPDLPLTIAACDTGALYRCEALDALLADDRVDVIVWAARGHPPATRRPEMYGWIEADAEGQIQTVSVKVPLDAPASDPIVIGTFTFKRAGDFVAAANRMIEREARVNGEFYVDTCINDALALGLNCQLFEIDHYLCWGTPEELESYEYWQSCLHKWPSHPYRLECDPDLPAEAIADLDKRCQAWQPPLPGARA